MKSAALILLACALTLQDGRAEEPTGVNLALLSATTAVSPGQPFLVGLRICHHEGYHTYWKNPGIVGMPTSLDWSLPEGFSAGPIQWPSPEMVDMAGHRAHGFQRDILLVVRITPPREIASEVVSLKATANWMACAKTCHPGSATFSLELPVSTKPTPSASQALFQQAAEEMPAKLRGFTAELTSDREAAVIKLRLTATDPTLPAPRNLYFFSGDGQVSSDQTQELRPTGEGRYLLTLPRSEFGPTQVDEVSGVLRASTPLNPDGATAATLKIPYPKGPKGTGPSPGKLSPTP